MILRTGKRNCERELSVCIPVYDRPEFIQYAVKSAINDKRVTDVVVVDDGSRKALYLEMVERLEKLFPSVRIIRSERNRGPFVAKLRALESCRNDWAVILDSDNKLDKRYVKRLYQLQEWDEHTIYVPEFARPHFDFRKYAGMRITADVASNMLSGPDARLFTTLLNTGNFLVPVKEFTRCLYEYKNLGIRYADVIATVYEWLRNDNELYVVPALYP